MVGLIKFINDKYCIVFRGRSLLRHNSLFNKVVEFVGL